jgi:hypothetical protein
MTKRSQAILVGLTLGDGYLSKPIAKSRRTSYLDIKYDEKYLPYLQWLHAQLAELNPSEIKKKKDFHQYRFYTETREDIGKLRDVFYPENIKIVPVDIIKYLQDPISLAIWYQDDGTLDFRDKYHANSLFATHCFSRTDNERLADTLKTLYGLDVRVCRCFMRGKLYFRLYVTSKSMSVFMKIISPYIQECFQYKMLEFRKNKCSQQQR